MAPRLQDALDALVDMREYDVPYHMRFQIDTDVRCGLWYDVRAKVSQHRLVAQDSCCMRANPWVLHSGPMQRQAAHQLCGIRKSSYVSLKTLVMT